MSVIDNLNGNIEVLKKNLSSPYTFKGSTTFAALPTTGNAVNDTYYCTDKKCKYTWNGSAWFQSSLNETEYEETLAELSEEIAEVESSLSSDIVELDNFILSNETVVVRGLGNVKNSVWKYQSSVGVTENTIYLTSNNNFGSWAYEVEKSGYLYVGDDILALSYCALAYGKNASEWYEGEKGQTVDCDYCARYRISENNMPTVNNPLYVNKGDLIVITIPNMSGTLCLYGSIFDNRLSNNLLLNDKQINQIKPTLNISKVSESVYDIVIGDYLLHYKNASIGSYSAWNLLGIACGSDILVTENTDILGPIREENNTYIGGVHGYENTKTMVIFVDGMPLSANVGNTLSCNRIDIVHISDVYSSVDNSLKWERYYHLIFENGTLSVETNYKCVAENGASVKRANNGGIFGSPNNSYNALIVTNGFYSTPPTSDTTETLYLDDKTDTISYLYNNGSVITMENVVGKENESYKCILTVYGAETPKRTKIYFLTIDSLTEFSKNQTIFGKFKLYFS